jgi:hypothetical protein
MTLPPLPEPAGLMLSELQSGTSPIYTEAQLLAYRDAVIEACAKVCDLEENDLHSSNESRNTAEHLGNSIRKLKEPK